MLLIHNGQLPTGSIFSSGTPQVDWLSERIKRCRNTSKEIRLGAFSQYSSLLFSTTVAFNKSCYSLVLLETFGCKKILVILLTCSWIVKIVTLSLFRVIVMVVLPVTWILSRLCIKEKVKNKFKKKKTAFLLYLFSQKSIFSSNHIKYVYVSLQLCYFSLLQSLRFPIQWHVHDQLSK